jgi:hypothetical protein
MQTVRSLLQKSYPYQMFSVYIKGLTNNASVLLMTLWDYLQKDLYILSTFYYTLSELPQGLNLSLG